MKRVLLSLCLAGLPAHSQDLAASLGKQRAASSRLEWETRDAGHPVLGDIRFAFLKTPVETPVGNARVFSRAYFSCQKGTGRFAIELSNGAAPNDTGGLKSGVEPRLYCHRPIQPWDEKLVQEELLATWDVNSIGDALARGLRPFPLRECVSIRVVQEVVLPQGRAQKRARVEFEILPYSRELDSIFVTCGEQSAYARAAPAAPVKPAVAAAPAAPSMPATPLTAPQETAVPWLKARITSKGKTNVRAGPTLESAIVTQLDPGTPVLVQRTGGEWWRAKAAGRAPFEGYIRQDRLVFK